MSAETVIYEVELRAEPDIASEFDAWLAGHVREMLSLPGFLDAEVLRPDDADEHTWIARYRLASRADLDRYLAEEAPRMRADGLARFGDSFSASRRILVAPPQPTQLPAPVPEDLGAAPIPGAETQLCRNCGYPVTGPFCSECGQKTDVHVLSFREWFADIAEALFTFDSRVFRSITPLLFRPGFLTREFVRGRRARYIAPLRLYLFISIIFFLIAGGIANVDQNNGIVFESPATSQKHAAQGDTPASEDDINVEGLDWLPMHKMVEAKLEAQIRRAKADPRGFMRGFTNSILNNVPKMMFFFLPLVALMLKLLYIGSERYYLEHLVFSLHFHAFFFLALIVYIAAGQLGETYGALATPMHVFNTVIWLYMPYYLFRAMRVNYEQGRFKTLVKYCLLGFGYLVSLTFTLTATTLLTALTT